MKLSVLILAAVSSYVILPGCWRENGEIDYVPDFTEMVQRGEIEQLNIGENFGTNYHLRTAETRRGKFQNAKEIQGAHKRV